MGNILEELFCRYTFIQEIQRVCEKGEYEEVLEDIIPILSTISTDTNVSVRAMALSQFEFISKVSLAAVCEH